MDDEDLAGLIDRVKAGDADAIRDLIHRFEGDVRMVVRVRLPQSLRSQFDSMDFVQAVWQSVLTKDGKDLGRFTNARHFAVFWRESCATRCSRNTGGGRGRGNTA